MGPQSFKKRKLEQASRAQAPRRKKIKKQTYYSSGSSNKSESDLSESAPKPTGPATTSVPESSKRPQPHGKLRKNASAQSAPSSDEEGEDLSEEVETEGDLDDFGSSHGSESSASAESNSEDGPEASTPKRKRTKRNDPAAFASGMNAILSGKLSTSKRGDPVLARSRAAHEAAQSLADSKLEVKAKRKIRDEKKMASEKGRVKNVLIGDRKDLAGAAEDKAEDGMSAADIARQEKQLRKLAQRGVVKLYNAIYQSKVRGEEEARKARESGVVGSKRREEKVGEMGRKAFLDLVSGGG